MTTVFADTFYFLALLDSQEQSHARSVEASRNPEFSFITTEWILTEFGDAYCHPHDRADFISFYRSIINHPRFKIIAADTQLFGRGVRLFEQRPDKEWSLTDCLSFVVMQERDLAQALTGDKHFEQAGFIALLK